MDLMTFTGELRAASAVVNKKRRESRKISYAFRQMVSDMPDIVSPPSRSEQS
jgi:hypothetical protein